MREKHCWLAENKWLKAQANRLVENMVSASEGKRAHAPIMRVL
jgi:hypothetical protein